MLNKVTQKRSSIELLMNEEIQQLNERIKLFNAQEDAMKICLICKKRVLYLDARGRISYVNANTGLHPECYKCKKCGNGKIGELGYVNPATGYHLGCDPESINEINRCVELIKLK